MQKSSIIITKKQISNLPEQLSPPISFSLKLDKDVLQTSTVFIALSTPAILDFLQISVRTFC